MNSISLDIQEQIEKDSGIRANGPATYTVLISKIQKFRSSVIFNLVDGLRKMSPIKEPRKDVETFLSQATEKTRHIVGSRSAPSDITYIVAQRFIECDVPVLKLKALQLYDIVDDSPTGMEWDAIFWKLKTKYLSLE